MSENLMSRVLCSAGAKTQIHQIAKDISGHGNDLPLITPPARKDMVIKKVCTSACLGLEEFLLQSAEMHLHACVH